MKKPTNKQIQKHAEKETKILLKEIQRRCFIKIEKALKSGAISEDSEFLQKNSLLSVLVIEDVCQDYKIRYEAYKKEGDNIKKFI